MGAASSALATNQFVDREGELETLFRARERAATGRLQVVLISGEPGSGKTRLAQHFLNMPAHGTTALTARGHPFGATTSFGLWLEVLDQYLTRLRCREDALPRELTPHRKLLLGITEVLRDLSAQSLLMISLDDIHLADGSSWETLDYLSEPLASRPVLIIACSRDGELPARGIQVLLAMEQKGTLNRVPLSLFNRQDTSRLAEALIGRDPPSPLVDWLVDHAGGNPLFITLLLQDLVARKANLVAPGPLQPPPALSAQVQSRVAGLSKRARTTLDVLAIGRRAMPFDVLAAVTSRRPEGLLTDLEALVSAHLVAEEIGTRDSSYRIVHPLIAEAISDAMLDARRRAIQRALARNLLARHDVTAAAAYFARSASPGDGEAVEALIAALHRSEIERSGFEAVGILDALLRLLPTGDRRWVRVLDAMVWDADWFLDYSAFVASDVGLRAMRAIERSLEDDAGPLRPAVVKLRIAGFGMWDVTHAETAARSCREALRVFEQEGEVRLALVARLWLAWLAGISDDLVQMEDLTRKVIAVAHQRGDSELLLHADGALAWRLLRRGDFAEAKLALDRAMQLARDRADMLQLTLAMTTLAYLEALRGRLDSAWELLEQAQLRSPHMVEPRLNATVALLAGDAQLAFDTLRKPAGATPAPPNMQHAWVLVYAVVAATSLGRVEEARTWLDAARSFIGRVGFGWRWFFLWAEGCLRWAERDLGAAAHALQQAAAGLERIQYLPAAAIVSADLIEVLSEANELHELQVSSRRLRQLASRLHSEPYTALAMLAQAHVSLTVARGVPRLRAAMIRSAASMSERAARTFGSLGYQCWEARALEVRARALFGSNRRLASEAFRRVVEISSRRPVQRERALAALEQLGRSGRRQLASVGRRLTLSAREQQVVALALQGLTARDIGRRLSISKRTAESHLANVYAKVGVRSRFELLRRAGDLAAEPSAISKPLPKIRSRTDVLSSNLR